MYKEIPLIFILELCKRGDKLKEDLKMYFGFN